MNQMPSRQYVSLLTAQEVSTKLAIPLPKLYELAATGRIPAVRLGHNWRFPRRLLEAWRKAKAPGARTHPGQAALPLIILIV